MNFKSKIKSILVIALTLGFFNCGSSGTGNGQVGFGNSSGTSAFTVSSTSPAHNQYYVSKSTHTITIRMTEAVAQSSIAGNVQLVKKINGQEENVTASFNTLANGEIITMNATDGPDSDTNIDDLSDNADYEIRLFPGLAAQTGDTLLQGQSFQFFYVDFSTGNGGTLGQSVAGPPSVSSISSGTPYSGTCFAAQIQFSESLAYQPTIVLEYHGTSNLGLPQWKTEAGYAYPVQSNNQTIWQVDLSGYACNDLYTAGGVKVHVNDYVDLEGNHGSPYCRKQETFFGSWSGC